MTTKMKGVRGQPLLEAPADIKSLELTLEDIDMIRGGLGYYRDMEFPTSLARTYHHLMILGHPQDIPQQDRNKMMNYLKGSRTRRKYIVNPSMLYNMKELGVLDELSEDDKTEIPARLQELRGKIDPTEGTQINSTEFFNLMDCIESMRGLGFTVKVEDAEEMMLRDYLKDARESAHGADIARSLYYLSKLCGKKEATEHDITPIGTYLNNMRTGVRRLKDPEDFTFHIANMQIWIREAIPPQTKEVGEMPPLKKL